MTTNVDSVVLSAYSSYLPPITVQALPLADRREDNILAQSSVPFVLCPKPQQRDVVIEFAFPSNIFDGSVKGISETLARQLKRFAHKPASSLREVLCRVKDPVPKEQLTNVIYGILCANCPCVYIVHTGQCIGTRINEHKLAVRRRDPLFLGFAHALEHDHRFNWDGTEVIAKANTRHQTLPTEEEKALRSLKTDDKIVIMSADKGGAIVIVDKADYVNKANQIFDDREAYAPLAADPTKNQAAAIKKKVNELAQFKLIGPDDSRSMTLNDPRIARAYGLPKVHKTDAQLRIIVPLIGSPTCNLAKWLYRHLMHLTNGLQYSIENSQAFLQKIHGLEVSPDECILSFDVVALFSSIPHDLAIDSVARCLERSPIGIPTENVLDMLKFCVMNYCQFDDKYYQQVKGTPMSSTISGLLAELVLQRLEQDVVQTFETKMWLRYVDDTFVIIKTSEVERLHQNLNSVSPAIQFTREEATGDTLPFLDVSIQRLGDGKLATSVHRKDSSAEIILNYGSNHSATHKRNCVRTLFHRAYRICNSDDSLKKELAYLHRLFRSNGYPASFVKNCLRRQRQLPNPESHEDRERPEWPFLAY
ncbi:hypothetical protein SprV_0401704500 [Sparganum proliferum]